MNSWGGNPSTRYNYQIGHAWNHGSDYEFRNTNYGDEGDAARGFLTTSADAGIQSRVAVPTLGWVARDDNDSTCSFPDGDGGCLPASEVGDCRSDDAPVADPNRANVPSTPDAVADWVAGLVADGFGLDIVAMDNEPEIWGLTHYDVHPECSTYEEILDKYLTYAQLMHEVSPDSRLAGPVTCCWYDYWDIAPGPADGSGEEFLAWFLRNVKAHDDQFGQRTLDLLDVHYYPQSEVFNDETDDETNARRLRSTRSLWDPAYADESWISDVIWFIPRMKQVIEEHYPGTPLLISEWNFGAEEHINGAVTIAEVLGIYGREGVEAASYWRHPDVGSPGWFAFKMHGNYDGTGTRFGGDVVPATSSDQASVSAFAAADETAGIVRLMLINKDPAETLDVALAGIQPATSARRFSYGADALGGIVEGTADLSAPVALPPYSITIIEVPLA